MGHCACVLAVNELKREWPAVKKLMLSADTDNSAAVAVYRKPG